MDTQDVNNEFIRLIKILKKNRFTYKEIAKEIGIDHQKINNIKRKISSASEELIKKLYESFPQLHDLNHENPEPPRPTIDILSEIEHRLKTVEKENKRLRIEVNQMSYILNKLIGDLQLLGKILHIMIEGEKDPDIRDAFEEWPDLITQFLSDIGSPEDEDSE